MSLANSIIYGDEADVMAQLQAGANINEVDEYGFRPLIEAAIVNKTSIARFLLSQGAQVDEEDSTGRTALHWAVENNNLELSELLLSHKANPNHYTYASQPVLVNPILRNQNKLKNLLYDYKADLNFGLDYINTKLLGHRFELIGQVDIVDPYGKFTELDFEGFFLEFTLGIILQSLKRYRNNFAARQSRKYFKYFKYLIEAFSISTELIKFQQYLINTDHYSQSIDNLLSRNLLIIPVAHKGHAITFVKYNDLWAKCDRGENSLTEGSINIYQINQKQLFNKDFLKSLIYTRQTAEFMVSGYKKILDAHLLHRFPLSAQISGNCSWANVEAAIPTLLFLLMTSEKKDFYTPQELRKCMDGALQFYQQWCEWDKDRALYDCIQSMEYATPARKASKATILGAVLFQCCHYHYPKDVERAEKILKILTQKQYRFILESYINIYYKRPKTLPGENLIHLLDMCGLSWY